MPLASAPGAPLKGFKEFVEPVSIEGRRRCLGVLTAERLKLLYGAGEISLDEYQAYKGIIDAVNRKLGE